MIQNSKWDRVFADFGNIVWTIPLQHLYRVSYFFVWYHFWEIITTDSWILMTVNKKVILLILEDVKNVHMSYNVYFLNTHMTCLTIDLKL